MVLQGCPSLGLAFQGNSPKQDFVSTHDSSVSPEQRVKIRSGLDQLSASCKNPVSVKLFAAMIWVTGQRIILKLDIALCTEKWLQLPR